MTWWLLEWAAGLLSVLPVHEAGHALAARLLGGTDVELRREGWGGARVAATFPRTARGRRAAFFLAGAAANGAVAACAVGLARPWLAGIHIAFALLSLVPTTGSDGAGLLSLVDKSG